MSQSEVAQTVLEESGYTEMWQKERTAAAPAFRILSISLSAAAFDSGACLSA